MTTNDINILDIPKMVRAKELSQIFLNTAQATYDHWVKQGLIHRYKIGGGVYYMISEVMELIEKSKIVEDVA